MKNLAAAALAVHLLAGVVIKLPAAELTRIATITALPISILLAVFTIAAADQRRGEK